MKKNYRVQLLFLRNIILLQLILFSDQVLDWDLWGGEADERYQVTAGVTPGIRMEGQSI